MGWAISDTCVQAGLASGAALEAHGCLTTRLVIIMMATPLAHGHPKGSEAGAAALPKKLLRMAKVGKKNADATN